jgi:hypothetical protein
MEKTTKQLKEMYRDLMGCKCIPVEHDCVQQFVDYCKDRHNLVVSGGAITEKTQYLYID